MFRRGCHGPGFGLQLCRMALSEDRTNVREERHGGHSQALSLRYREVFGVSMGPVTRSVWAWPPPAIGDLFRFSNGRRSSRPQGAAIQMWRARAGTVRAV